MGRSDGGPGTLRQKWGGVARAGSGQRGMITGDLLSLLAGSPGLTSRTFWKRKEQPKLSVHLRRQLLKPVPSRALADFSAPEVA